MTSSLTRPRLRFPSSAALLLISAAAFALQNTGNKPGDGAGAAPSISSRTATMRHLPGLLPLDWDARSGKLYLEVPLDSSGRSADLLYLHSLPFGVGSNDLGLDRGQYGALGGGERNNRIVHFERAGPKLLLVQPNQQFRSSSPDPAEQLSVRQSFPESVLAGFRVEAEDPNGTVLVDATDLFLTDVHGIAEMLTRAHQGSYKVDLSRSAIELQGTRAFPRNTEVEALLTFVTPDSSHANFVADVSPDPGVFTVHEHQSFVALPGPGFTPRRFDPRAGYFPESYRDYSAPLGAPLDQQFILRHRLIKRDPACTHSCQPVEPLRYYVDRGAPEPIRTALVEGARWWDQAFQAAGWAPNTFQVEPLPAGADPMDLRYNIIQWVHRYTRGWSYGASVADPRTGEILKGNVTLGSLRGRQDYLIAEALLSPYVTGQTIRPGHDPMLAMVLARIRQLAAHETGHTLGLAHNFAASSFPHTPEQSVSVMDYPHPWITLGQNGVPDLSHAYAVNIGQWDKVAIDYGYREFDRAGKPVEDTTALNRILTEAEQRGIPYITDADSRPLGSAQPHAHLWDNGSDSAEELNRILGVRAAALARFGEAAIRPGTPTAQLDDTLVPLYLLHRYQTEAAAKEIGGLDYRYTLRGDGQKGPVLVTPAEQRKALAAVLRTLSPEVLTLPEPLLALLPPRPPGLERTRETFATHTGLTFDPVAAAESSADLTLALLFQPARASRLVEYHARDAGEPSLGEVIDTTLDAVAHPAGPGGLSAETGRAVKARVVEALLTLASNPAASSEARAITRERLLALRDRLSSGAGSTTRDPVDSALAARITEWERDPAKFTPAKPIEAPPGMPIGEDEEF